MTKRGVSGGGSARIQGRDWVRGEGCRRLRWGVEMVPYLGYLLIYSRLSVQSNVC